MSNKSLPRAQVNRKDKYSLEPRQIICTKNHVNVSYLLIELGYQSRLIHSSPKPDNRKINSNTTIRIRIKQSAYTAARSVYMKSASNPWIRCSGVYFRTALSRLKNSNIAETALLRGPPLLHTLCVCMYACMRACAWGWYV